jgi:hypothetical protein
MLICPAISDTDHVQPRRNNHGSQLSGNIMDEAMRPLPKVTHNGGRLTGCTYPSGKFGISDPRWFAAPQVKA